MKPIYAFCVFFLLAAAALLAGIDSLYRAERLAQQNVDHALALTLQQCEPDRIDADTIRVYRSLITMAAVRDTAYLSLAMSEDGEQRRAQLTANTGLTLGRLWLLSDQRASGVLGALAALWLAASLCWIRRQQKEVIAGIQIGLLQYDEDHRRFLANGSSIRFTPMQQQLMELFMEAPDYRLRQQDICDRLWPKKPDASATLYTLIRRLKGILHETAGLNIVCQRGEAYQLVKNTELVALGDEPLKR